MLSTLTVFCAAWNLYLLNRVYLVDTGGAVNTAKFWKRWHKFLRFEGWSGAVLLVLLTVCLVISNYILIINLKKTNQEGKNLLKYMSLIFTITYSL